MRWWCLCVTRRPPAAQVQGGRQLWVWPNTTQMIMSVWLSAQSKAGGRSTQVQQCKRPLLPPPLSSPPSPLPPPRCGSSPAMPAAAAFRPPQYEPPQQPSPPPAPPLPPGCNSIDTKTTTYAVAPFDKWVHGPLSNRKRTTPHTTTHTHAHTITTTHTHTTAATSCTLCITARVACSWLHAVV